LLDVPLHLERLSRESLLSLSPHFKSLLIDNLPFLVVFSSPMHPFSCQVFETLTLADTTSGRLC